MPTIAHKNLETPLPRRLVILGAGGFVSGSLAVHFQSRGIIVKAIGSSSIDLSEPETAPLLAKTLGSEDTLVVSSALTPEKGRDVGTMIKNLKMIETVTSAIDRQPVGHLIYFSSDAVYGITDGLVTEEYPAAPSDLYGLMHRSREIALQQVTERRGIPYCIVRPSAIYGARDTHNSYGPNRFIRSALLQRRIDVFGQGEETRDHVSIDDVVALSSQIITRRSSGLLNLVSGRAISFVDLANMVAVLVGGSVRIINLPRTIHVTHRLFDSSAIKQSFPDYFPTALEMGLGKMIAEVRRG